MANMEKILFLGDSISVHYAPFLLEKLEGKRECYFRDGLEKAKENLDIPQAGNSGDTRRLLVYIKSRAQEGTLNFDKVCFNAGLHDIKTDINSGEKAISLTEYRQNLLEIVDLITGANATPIWVNITPVDEELHKKNMKYFYRYNQDVLKYNKAAEEIMGENKIKVIDLYSFTKKFGKEAYLDHVHYKEEIREKQAEFIIENL